MKTYLVRLFWEREEGTELVVADTREEAIELALRNYDEKQIEIVNTWLAIDCVTYRSKTVTKWVADA